MEKLILMDPHEKWTHKVDSVVHWRPRLDAAQSPMFYSTVCFSRESKGQSQAGFYSPHVLNSFFIIPPPFCLAFCFPPAFLLSRAILVFNQANILIVCRVPILSSPIKSFLRRNSTSAAINTSAHPKIRESEDPKKMAMKASATIISASDLDSDGEDGPLVSLMGKLSVERKAKAQNVEYTRDSIVVDQSSVGISCNLGPGNLEAILAFGDKPVFVRMNPRPKARDEDATSPKRQLETSSATAADAEASGAPPDQPEPMDQSEGGAACPRPPRSPVRPPGSSTETPAPPAEDPPAKEHPGKRARPRYSKRQRAARRKAKQADDSSEASSTHPQQQQQQQRQQQQPASDPPLRNIIEQEKDRKYGRQPQVDARTTLKWKKDAQLAHERKRKEAVKLAAARKRLAAARPRAGQQSKHQHQGRPAVGPSQEEEEARAAALASRPSGPSAAPRGPSRHYSSGEVRRAVSPTPRPAAESRDVDRQRPLPAKRRDATHVERDNFFSDRTRDYRYKDGQGVRIERADSSPPPPTSSAAITRGGTSSSAPSAAGWRPSASPASNSDSRIKEKRSSGVPVKSHRAHPGWAQRPGPSPSTSTPAPVTSRPRRDAPPRAVAPSTNIFGAARPREDIVAMDREATERNLQEMRDFSKQQKISYAKMAREQEDREKRLEEKERALELKRREAEDLLEEAKRVAERRDGEVREDDPEYDYYVSAAAEAEARRYPASANRSHTRSWEEIDDDLIDLQGFSDPE